MGQVGARSRINRESLFDLAVRQGVGVCTVAVHLSLFWGNAPFILLGIAVFQTLLYPIALLLWDKTRTNTRLSLSMDTFVYGCYVAAWGFNPILLALYLGAANAINLSAGGVQFWVKCVCYFGVGMILGGGVTGFYFRLEAPNSALISGACGSIFFLTAFGYRVFHINSHLRSVRNRLHGKTSELESISRLALAVNAHLDIDVLLENIMLTIEGLYPFEALYIVRYEEDKKILEVAGIYGSTITLDEYAAFERLELDCERDRNSIFVRTLLNQKVAYIPEVTPELIASASYIDRQLYSVKPSVSMVYLPVYVKDKIVAGACFINYQKRFYLAQEDIEKVQAFLVQVGTAIRNATLFKDLNSARLEAETARQKAEASEEAKGRFLANMSHEIRTPLTAILGYAEALQEDQPSEEERVKFVDYILRSGKHLLSMINDILDISKIEANKIEVERIPCNYIETLYDIDSYLSIKCKEKNIHYTLTIHYPVPRTIITDPTRLKQILFNLCNNAVKFTESGGIELALSIENQRIVVRVIDTGIGIDEEVKNKIFAAFDQADSSTTRLFGGSGLGLYISKNLSALLGGDLTVESTKGVGSTFTLSLPILAETDNLIANKDTLDDIFSKITADKISAGVPKLSGRVLLAEDNPDNQKLISRLVSLTGLTVDIVHNGEEAVTAATSTAYDIILMDMQMPVMGGLEASSIIWQHNEQIPIIAFTANVMKHQIDEYTERGFAGILEKPIVRQRLYTLIQTTLDRSPSKSTRKVLVVEDDEVNQLILSRHVNKTAPDAKVFCAGNGIEALKMSETNQFDLILMDMEMPQKGGLETTQILRQSGFNKPIYIVTGNTGSDIVDRCLSAGATGHLAKPLDKELVQKAIKTALSPYSTII